MSNTRMEALRERILYGEPGKPYLPPNCWIEWSGGESREPPEFLADKWIRVKLRNGFISPDDPDLFRSPDEYRWNDTMKFPGGGEATADIVAYMIKGDKL